jgi:hypothetical protein
MNAVLGIMLISLKFSPESMAFLPADTPGLFRQKKKKLLLQSSFFKNRSKA